MTVQLQGVTGIVLMPNPDLSDSEAIDQSVNHRFALDGTNYTYVKSSGNRRLTLTFSNQGRGKILEVAAFYEANAGNSFNYLDHNDIRHKVVFESGPLAFQTDGRAAPAGSFRQEQGSFELVLVEVE